MYFVTIVIKSSDYFHTQHLLVMETQCFFSDEIMDFVKEICTLKC